MSHRFRLLWWPWGLLLTAVLAGCGGGNSAGTGGSTTSPPAKPDFSISAPRSVTVTANATETIAIAVDGVNGFSSPVQVSLSGLPAGATATPSSFTLSPSASDQSVRAGITSHASTPGPSQTVVITTDKAVVPEAVPLTITGTSGSLTHSETTGTTQPDFALAGPAATMALVAGSTEEISVTAEGINGFSGTVVTTLSGLPTGVTASPSTFTLTPGTPQTITLAAAPNVTAGTATPILQGTSGTISHTAEFFLAVSPVDATPGFTLSATPGNVTLQAGGGSQTLTVLATAVNGITGPINTSVTGLPAGVTAFPGAFTLLPGSVQFVTLSAAASAAAGTATLTIQGTSGSISQHAPVVLTTTVPPANFNLSITPASITLQAGGAPQSFTVSAAAVNNFTGPVSLVLNNLPAGVSGPSSRVSVQAGTSAVITLSATSGAATGAVPISVTGTAGALVHTVPLTLTIAPAGDFSLSLNPASLTLTPGGSAGQVTLSAAALNGFTSSISVTLSGLPNGVAAQPSTFALSPGGSLTVSLSAASTNQAQTAAITFTAASAGLTHTATLPLTITQPPPSFNLQVTPGSLSLVQGGPSQTLSITANATNGFSGQVTLAFSGSPNITVSPNSVALAPGTPQTVNVSAAANATVGENTVTVTGTSGLITQTSSVPVTVNSSAPDFTLSVYPPVINVSPGSDAPMEPIEILATPLNNFSDPIAVTFAFPPAVQWSGGALPLAPGIPQETDLVQNGSVIAGSTVVTVTATSPTVTHTAQFTLNSSDTVVPDFAFFAAPTALLLAPGQTSISICPCGFNGFTGQISTELSGLPAGASANFSSGELTANSALTLTITVPLGTAPGSGVLALKGTAGSLSHEIDLPYSVLASPGIRQYVGPATLTLNQGSAANILLGAETTLAGNITTTANPLPAGVTSPFFTTSGFSLSGNEVQGIYLPLTAATNAPVGQSTLTFTSTDGTNTTTSQVMLNVVSQPNFTLSAPASLTVPAGGTGTFSLEATAINGFNGTVTANLSGANGLSASPGTVTLTPGVAQPITVTATTTAANGSIAIAATSGTLSQSLNVPITVGPVGPSYTITEPNGVLQLGTYVDSTFQISTASGIPLPANATITGFPPGLLLAEAQDPYGDTNYGQGTTLNYLTASCPGGTQLCKASYFSIAYDGAAAGTYPLTLTATWYSITQTVPLTLVVIPPDFTVSVSQSPTVVPGTTQGFTAAVQVNLSGTVTLALENLPAGVTTGNPVTITSSGNVSLGFIASAQAVPGTYMISLVGTSTLTKGTTTLPTGSSGAPAHTIQFPLTIATVP